MVRRTFSSPRGAIAVLVCVGALGLIHGAQAGGAEKEERASTPKVVCKAAVFGKRFLLNREPSECLFHQEGAPSWAGLQAITVGQEMNWSSWGGQTARASGKVFISSAGPKPARFLLKRPRKVCGQVVFTRLRVNLDGLPSGGPALELTSCVR